MKKSVAISGILMSFVFSLSGALASSSPQDDPAKQIEMLKKQVAALEQRVKGLEIQMEKLTIMIPQTFPNLTQLPKGWEKREFNGREYFVIPIDKEKAEVKPAIR